MSGLKEKIVLSEPKDNIEIKTALVDGVYITNQSHRKQALSSIWAKYNMLPDNLTQSLGRLYDAVEEIYLPNKNEKSLYNYTHDKLSVYSRSIAEKNLTVKEGNVQCSVTETPREAYNSWYGTPYQNKDYYNVFENYKYNSNGVINQSYAEAENQNENFSRIISGDANAYDIIDHDKDFIYENFYLTYDKKYKKYILDKHLQTIDLPEKGWYANVTYKDILKINRGIKKRRREYKKRIKEIDQKIDNLTDTPKILLTKTAKLFSENKIDSLVARFHGGKVKSSAEYKEYIDTARSKYGNSHGRNLLKKEETSINGYNNPYCRVWTFHHQYGTSKEKLIRPFYSNDGRVKNVEQSELTKYFRSEIGGEYLQDYSVLKNGFIKITPDKIGDNHYDTKRSMFSIENLAWKDVKIANNLSADQIGPNGGRIMWFPPYDLQFQESSQANWNETNFIGRGEPIYTYTNTKRTGSLSFTLLIDHPSIMNIFDKRSEEEKDKIDEDNDILRFFAGCDIPMKLNTNIEENSDEGFYETEGEIEAISEESSRMKFSIYFPNNYSGHYRSVESIDDDWAEYLFWGVGTKIDNETKIGYEIDSESGITMEKEAFKSTCIIGEENIDYYYRYDNDLCQKLSDNNLIDNTSFSLNANNGNNNISFMDLYTKLFFDNTQVKEFAHKIGILGGDYNFTIKEVGNLNHLFGCQINIIGMATSQDTNNSNELATRRATSVKKFLEENLPKLGAEILDIKTNVNIIEVKDNNVNSRQSKEGRRVDVEIKYNLPVTDTQGVERKPLNTKTRDKLINKTNFTAPKNEADYFKNLEKIDNFAYQKIKDKIKYFEPAYHSISPEGFNSRLTFLHQCTRQGHTLERSENAIENIYSTVGNMAFGRPPFCILRIGDFINTKILIKSLNIVYQNGDGMQWDMNSEGIGIQPMFAKVTMQIEIIGGQSLDAPISRLNNAVSFNYYANAGVYDNRADVALHDANGIVYSKPYTTYNEGIGIVDIGMPDLKIITG